MADKQRFLMAANKWSDVRFANHQQSPDVIE
jgi:hypothetical protein